MAVKEVEQNIVGIKPSSVALLEATFGAVIGFGIAVLRSLEATVAFGKETESVLAGLSFGIASGIVLVIVLPLVYFSIGWLLGYINGWVLNVIVRASGGFVVYTEK
jgi:hypothetical protein